MEQIVSIDASRRVRIWVTGEGLHILAEDRDGRGGYAAGQGLTVPANKGSELAQAIETALS